jgi:hypothetical protein
MSSMSIAERGQRVTVRPVQEGKICSPPSPPGDMLVFLKALYLLVYSFDRELCRAYNSCSRADLSSQLAGA